MNNKLKTWILIIVILLVACIMVWCAYKIIVESNGTTETVSNVTSKPNEVKENFIINENEKNENSVENKDENINNVENENNNKITSDSKQDEKNNNSITNEERAINIVKKNWGNEEGVYFTTMGIDVNGRYIVTVNDSSTTAILVSYAVNIETGEFEVQ